MELWVFDPESDIGYILNDPTNTSSNPRMIQDIIPLEDTNHLHVELTATEGKLYFAVGDLYDKQNYKLMELIDTAYKSPTYNVVLSSSDIDQGESFGATITTTNIVPGTYLYYQLTGITAGDVTDPSQRYGYAYW